MSTSTSKKSGPAVMDTLFNVLSSGRSWIAAEAALAKAEVASDGRQVVTLIILAAVVMGSIFSAVVLLAGCAVFLVAPHVGGIAGAAGILAIAFAVLAAVGCAWIVHIARSRLGISSVLKRWGSLAAGSDQ